MIFQKRNLLEEFSKLATSAVVAKIATVKNTIHHIEINEYFV